MEYDRYQKFRQQTYQMLGKAKDATFELMHSVLKDTAAHIMTTRNVGCLAELSLSPLFRELQRKNHARIKRSHKKYRQTTCPINDEFYFLPFP